MINEAIKELLLANDLSDEIMYKSMEDIMTGASTEAQIGSFLSLLAAKGERSAEIAQAAKVMSQHASRIEIDGDLIDTCSTGGSGTGHFNISTASAFLLAASGLKVAKHGNRAASGRCGSADVLESMGVRIDLSPEQVKDCIVNTGMGFMFAPRFHSAMKYAAGPRKELGIILKRLKTQRKISRPKYARGNATIAAITTQRTNCLQRRTEIPAIDSCT